MQRLTYLLDAYQQEQETANYGQRGGGQAKERDDPEALAREQRRAERERKKERRLLSLRRILRYGETHRIVELRFASVGSLEPRGLSYLQISKKLYIRRKTVISVCRAYLKRGGTLRPPGVHWRRG